MKQMNKKCYSNITVRVQNCIAQLGDVQQQLADLSFDKVLQEIEKELATTYSELVLAEEEFLRDKSRVKWLKDGDKNIAFFHRTLKIHHTRNKILTLTTNEGIKLTEYEDVKQEAIQFYQNLFTEFGSMSKQMQLRLHNVLTNKLSEQQAKLLAQSISNEEIKSALFLMKKGTAPGPEGYTVEFFKSNWNTIGDDFIAAILHCFATQTMPIGLNSAILNLVPKIAHPVGMKEYKPIACCNVVYKVYSKVLTERLKSVLDGLISNKQAAFLKGRSISGNALLMHELVRNYHKKGGQERCVGKVDIIKAYDTVRRSFLLEVAKILNFPPIFINWVMNCFCIARFSINLNGLLMGYFDSSRGLKQEDPISPYLFLLVMEVFTQLFDDNIRALGFDYHPRCESLKLSHIIFADDLFLMATANAKSLSTFRETLNEFAKMSGLRPNMAKSEIFITCVLDEDCSALANVIGMPLGKLSVKYLGVPLIFTRLTTTDCQPIIDKTLACIRSWSARKLPYRGILGKNICFAKEAN